MAHLYVFDKNDNFLEIIDEDQFKNDEHKRKLNGSWTFRFEVNTDYLNLLLKGYKIGFYDREDQFRLFTIAEVPEVTYHEDLLDVYCTNDYFDLVDGIIEDKRLRNGSAREALNKVLEGTKFEVGVVADLGINTINFYDISRIEALENIVKLYGGEIDYRIELNDSKTGISRRIIDLKERLGSDTGIRYTFDSNIKEFKRKDVSEGHFTVLYGRGRGVESGDGYSNKIKFTDIEWKKPKNQANKPLGQSYIEDEEAIAKWGRIEGIYENSDIEDPEELLRDTYNVLQKVKTPSLSYETTVKDLSNQNGYDHLKVMIGDSVILLDEDYDLNFESRIVEITESIKGSELDQNLILGYIQPSFTDSLGHSQITSPSSPSTNNIQVDDTNFPNTLPSTPTLRAKGLFSSIVLEWTFESKTYYNYEIYASEIQHFNPDPSNLIFRGKASSLLHEVKPSETWYYRARAINTHGEVTEMSEEVSATSFKISDATEYFEDVAIKEALIDTLSLDRGWFGQLKGQFLDVKNLVVTDGNNVRTMYVDDFGRVHMNVSELKINSKDVLDSDQTETLIKAKAGEISLEVAKNEVNNLQIGVSNLLLDSHERKRLDRPTTNYNQISYNIIDSYKDLRLEQDTTFSLTFLVDRVANTQFECFDTITFDVGWRHRWTRNDIQEIIHMKGDTYKFIMKPKVLPKGASIADKLTLIGEYQYGGGIFYNVMLTQGSKPMDWSRSSGEIPTTTQMNSVVNQKADSITSEVSKIERSLAIDNILENGNFTNGLNSWTYLDYGRPVNYTISANTDWVMKGKNALLLTATNHPQGVDSGFVQTVDVKPNTDYTFTGYMASHRAEAIVILKDNNGAWLVHDKTNPDVDNYTGGQDISKWKRVRIVYNSGNRNKLHLHLALAKSNNNGHVWFHDFMVTEGDNDLCWKPSEKETRTKITQLSDRITSTVTSINTVDGKVNKAQSEIDQQAERISSKVSKDDFGTLVQQNGQSVMVAINNKRTSMGVYIDENGLSGFNNNVRTFRLTEGKFHVYNSWNSRHIGYFGTLGDDLRATLFGTNTFSVFSDDKALLFRAKYEREARYGNATLDMCGGINFIHKPGQSTGTNQFLLGNHDLNNQYGMHNLFIRCHNSLGFTDNGNMTNMFFKTRTGDIVMKGRVYQNTATPPRSFSMNFDGEDEVYRSGFTRSQAVDAVMHLKTGVHVDSEGECCSAIYGGHDELITTKYKDKDGVETTHINTNALNASLVVTCQEQQKIIEALQKELKEIKECLKIA